MTGFGRLLFASPIGLVLVLTDVQAVWTQNTGHRVSDNQVVVNSRNHWQNWTFPPGTLVISPEGEVQAQRIEKNTNAALDIVDYLRFNPPPSLGDKAPETITLTDAIEGRSNVADVAKVFDGDMTTYWEPAPPSDEVDLALQWWFIVDLGRLVFAKKLVVRFVEEGLGDPFLLFDVLVSNGREPSRVQGSGARAFETVLRTLRKNKSQRVFEVDLTEREPTIEAAPVRFVQILVTGTDGPLGTEITRAEYEALTSDQGAIQYFKRQLDGREMPVAQRVYELLDEERQGRILYFRRERPRLAELEVWNEGDELVAGLLDRGGTIATTAAQTLALKSLVDGNLDSFSGIYFGVESAVPDPVKELVFDLGAFYWIDTYRLAYSGLGGGRFGSFRNYRLDFSDGSLAADGQLKWITRATLDRGQTVYGRAPNARLEGTQFEPIKARFARIQWNMERIGTQIATMAEMQFYGEGFQPEVSLESDLIRLGGSRNLHSIEWDADELPGTRVLIQTRTGDELGQVLHYFKNDGTEVTEEQYGKLLSIFKGDIVAEEVPLGDWGDWSEPYARAEGSPVTSPSPREFLTIRATLLSDDPDLTPTLRSIRLHFADPVAQSLRAEIAPFQVDQLGVERVFSLYVQPHFERLDPGFDELLLTAPANMALSFGGVFGGRADEFNAEADEVSALEQVEVVPTAPDSLLVRFPNVGPDSAIEILRLDFTAALFTTGAVLQAALRNSAAADGGTWQRIDPGDVLAHIPGNTTTVVSSFESQALLTEVAVRPAVFSPNGDGINDRTFFLFKVVRVEDDSPVEAAVYHLDGRRVRVLGERRALSAGSYEIGWDGRDEGGALVPPGLYCVRLGIRTNTVGTQVEDKTVLRTVAVAY